MTRWRIAGHQVWAAAGGTLNQAKNKQEQTRTNQRTGPQTPGDFRIS